MKKLFFLTTLFLICAISQAQVIDVTVYDDCSRNGSVRTYAPVPGYDAGRTQCEYVQLWADGPKWAAFNVGATIADYANLTTGTDTVTGSVAFYNTANVGSLHGWNNWQNGREYTWSRYEEPHRVIDDVATNTWGDNWMTPTKAQQESLLSSTYTNWTWCDGTTTQYVPGCTLKGYKVSGVGEYADKSVFLPAAGYYDYTNHHINDAGICGCYWSETAYTGRNFYNAYFSSSRHEEQYADFCMGYSVRAILSGNGRPAGNKTLKVYANDCNTFNEISCPNGQQVRVKAEAAQSGYRFVKWSDGNTDNPRLLTVTSDTTLKAVYGQNVSVYYNGNTEPSWTGATLEAAVGSIPADTTATIVVNVDITTTDYVTISNGKKVTLFGANSNVNVRLNHDILVTGAASLTIHDITLTAVATSPDNYTHDGLVGLYNATLKITGNTTVDASAAYINGIAANGSNSSHLTIRGDGNLIKGCMLTSGGNVNRRGLMVDNSTIRVSLKSGTYMGHGGAIYVAGDGTILSVLGDDHTYFEADSTTNYKAAYDTNGIDRTIIVKSGAPYTCKLTENGTDTYYTSFWDAWTAGYNINNSNPLIITLFCDEKTVLHYNYYPTWSGSHHLTIDGRGHTLWQVAKFYVAGRLTLRNVTLRPQSYFNYGEYADNSTALVMVEQNGHLTLDNANIIVTDHVEDPDYEYDDHNYYHFSLDAIKIMSNACSLTVKSGIIQGSLKTGDAKRALIVDKLGATIRLFGGTFSGVDGAMYISQPSSGSLHAGDLLAPGCEYFTDDDRTTFFNNQDYAVTQIGTTVTVGGYYNLTVLDAGWASLCLPYDATIPEGVTVYYASDTTGGHLTLSPIADVLPAGEGVMVHADAGNYLFCQTDTKGDSIHNYLAGTVLPTEMNRGENYVYGGIRNNLPTLILYGDAADREDLGMITLSALKAYLPGNHCPSLSDPFVSCVIGGVPTGIDSLAAPAATKVFQDGQVLIIRDGVRYNALGAKL